MGRCFEKLRPRSPKQSHRLPVRAGPQDFIALRHVAPLRRDRRRRVVRVCTRAPSSRIECSEDHLGSRTHSNGSRRSLDDYLKIVLLADVKLVLRQSLNWIARAGHSNAGSRSTLMTAPYWTLMSSQGALRAAQGAPQVVSCAGNVSWLEHSYGDQSLLVSRSQATPTCALYRHAASEALPELGSTAPAWRPAEKANGVCTFCDRTNSNLIDP